MSLIPYLFMVTCLDTEHLSEFTTTDCETDGGFLTEVEGEGGSSGDNSKIPQSHLKPHVKGFLAYDAKYFFPFFTRHLTAEVSAEFGRLLLIS